MYLLWDIQPSVLVSFCQAIVTVKFPYEKIFTIPGKVWLHSNVIMWQIDSNKFPGPALTALPTGHATYRWWHGCSEASLRGIFYFEGEQDSIAAGLTSKLAFHAVL